MQSKKQVEKMRRRLKSELAVAKKFSTTFMLEPLEARVLLSADLAGAVTPIKPAEAVPPQAVVLNLPAPGSAVSSTVAEILARPTSASSQIGQQPQNIPTATPALIIPPSTQNVANQINDSVFQSAIQPLSSTVSQDVMSPLVSSQNEDRPLTVAEIMGQPSFPAAQSKQSNGQSESGPVTASHSLGPLSVVQEVTSAPSTADQVPSKATTSTAVQTNLLQSSQNGSSSAVTSSLSSVDTVQQSAGTATSASQSSSATTELQVQPAQPVANPSTTSVAPITSPILSSNGAVNPTLPLASVDTSMPSTSVTVRVGPHGEYTNLQDALNNVSLGTTILLEPGVSYTTTNERGFVLPNKTTGSGWIVIRPDMPDSALPAQGTRVTSNDSAWMPKIIRGNGNLYAISSDPGAHNYRVMGVEIMNQGNKDTPLVGAAFVNLTSLQETSLNAQSHHILFDRIYIHGPSAGGSIGVKFGLLFGGQHEGVIDSTIEDITYGADAIAVGSWSGAGPFLIRNNALSSSGENIMFGGADTQIAGLIPSDIEIRGNYIYKPLKWRDDPAYNSGAYKITVKNLLESKNVQRMLIDGNVFENMWPGAQAGFAITLTPRQAQSSSVQPWTVVQDVTITNNTIKNTANGIAISGRDPGFGVEPATSLGGRIRVDNNLLLNTGGYPGAGKIFQLGNGAFDVIIQHNTVVTAAYSTGTTLMFTYGPSNNDFAPMERFVLRDNLLQAMSYPYHAEGGVSAAVPGHIWAHNAFVGPWSTSEGVNVSTMPQGNGNTYPASAGQVGYIDLSGGNYRLSQSSPYKDAASDGRDIGIDWAQFNTANS